MSGRAVLTVWRAGGRAVPVALVTALVALVAVLVATATATATATVTATPAAADPVARCTLSDPRLDEVSGLAWAPDGLRVVNDSGSPSTVYRLSPTCAVIGSRSVGTNGRDVEDLARAGDGTLWLADTGDNARARATVAVLRLPPAGGEIVTRLVYPDGPHDVEAMLLPADGRPVLVTKDAGGRGGVYTTDAPLPASASAPVPASVPVPVPLRRVGEVVVPPSDTRGGSGLASLLGGALITGGAVSGDGRVVALRTYTDAWLYPARTAATAPDVVAALAGTPVRVPLPGEPQGEALAFAPDGTLLSAGESPSGAPRGTVRAVPGAASLAGSAPGGATPAPDGAPAPVSSATPEPQASTGTAVVVGAVLLVLVAGGLLAVVRVRRRR